MPTPGIVGTGSVAVEPATGHCVCLYLPALNHDRTYAKKNGIETPSSLSEGCMAKPTRLDYCQYLLSSPLNYTLTHFADHSDRFTHDMLNRYLGGDRVSPRVIRGSSRGSVW